MIDWKTIILTSNCLFAIQSGLLASINQSSYLIYPMFSTDLNSKETSIYEITSRRLRLQILIFFSSFIFKDNPSKKL